jgi:hypothetical protein
MKDHEIWRTELFSEIRTIADASELRRLWSGKDAHQISSFAEEVAHVFDDFDIDGFIAAGPEKAKLRPEQFDALCKFRNFFSIYIDSKASMTLTTVDHESILSDPNWKEVTKAASEFISSINLGYDLKI